MAEDIGRLVASSKPVRSIYFIGFASQTNNPDHNQILARNRADFVRTLVQLHRAVKALDVDMRVIGVGEMPDVPWAGRQGDVSRRTVLVAVCRRDI
jgi:outer membrane protein OmpA-like peptidoglycan-associated protein